MSKLDDFISHNVEGYLFNDLRRMQTLDVGYPLLMTSFSGVELLGALLSNAPFDPRHGRTYFREYWRDWLYPKLPNSDPIGQALYQMLRHGIAHAFVLKGPVGVVRHDPAVHLRHDPATGRVYVDAVQLADDFIQCFSKHVKPLLAIPNSQAAASMLTRLDDVAYSKQAGQLGMAALFQAATAPKTAVSQSAAPGGSQQGPSGPGPLFGGV